MIKRIKVLKQFGIFKDFAWSGTLPDFREKNIIYGWNYSGKTTLSRLFNSLKEKTLPVKYNSAEFKILLNDNTEITHENISANHLNIQIFNSEYIKKNLKWDTEESLDAIAFDVGENIAIREEINANSERIDQIYGTETIIGKLTLHQPAIDVFNEFEGSKFTDEARRIKNDIFNSLIEFNKRHLENVKTSVQDNLDANIILDETEVQTLKQTATATNNKGKIVDVLFSPTFSDLKKTVENLLKREPSETEIIQTLQDNSSLYNWAKEGLILHNEKTKKCAFCDNEIESSRYTQLKNFFSNEAAKLRNEIVDFRNAIKEEVENLKNINIPQSKNDFADKFQAQFEAQFLLFSLVKKEYSTILKTLDSELTRKENGNIFTKLDICEIEEKPLTDLSIWIEKIQEIIDSHNNFVDNFNNEQSEAREKLKKHLIARFLKEEDYFAKQRAKVYSENCTRRYKCLIEKLKTKNLELEGQLKSIVAGQLELNKFIKIFLSRDDVKIDVTLEDKFVLKRGTDFAHNLSEGEKTAIAFAYFLVSLESLHKENNLVKQIIFIDDPISSLDSNHIAQVYSLINSFFFRKGIDTNNPEKVINCFKQFFISTHNFEFFSFLKDSSQINKKKKVVVSADKTENHPTCEYYMVKRIALDRTEIQPMPNSIKLYKSEYIYLFDLIFNFHKNGCQESDEIFILMPNALRRFLEIYTLMKLPHTRDEFESRVSELVGEGHQLKFLNHFSHFTTFEKLTKHDELIMALPNACQELIDLLGKDLEHFNSLKRAINAN